MFEEATASCAAICGIAYICYRSAASALLRARVLAMSSGSVVGQRLRCAQTLSTCAVFVFQVLPNTVNGINLLQRVNQGAH